MATVDDKKIIFSMVGVSKSFQNNKQVLKNIYLSFFYGAKIGIIGLNGSGKSTLLKIIAGLEKSYQGEVVFSPGYSVGYLAQEPYLDNTKTVKEIVMEGVQPIVDALNEYEEINQKFGLPEYYEDQDKMDALFTRQGELQDIIDATDAWNLDSKLERAMDALRCPPENQSVANLSGGERRRVALVVLNVIETAAADGALITVIGKSRLGDRESVRENQLFPVEIEIAVEAEIYVLVIVVLICFEI